MKLEKDNFEIMEQVSQYYAMLGVLPHTDTYWNQEPLGQQFLEVCRRFHNKMLTQEEAEMFSFRFLKLDPAFAMMFAKKSFIYVREYINWMFYLHLLQEYKKETGEYPNTGIRYQNVRIGEWLYSQYSYWKHGKMMPYRVQAFQKKLGFDISLYKETMQYQYEKKQKEKDKLLQLKFDYAKAYYLQTHLLPHSKAVWQEQPVGKYFVELCSLYKKDKLPNDIKLQFESQFSEEKVFFKVLQQDGRSLSRYLNCRYYIRKLKEYQNLYHDIPNYLTVFEGMKLGQWLYQECMKWKKGTLEPYMVKTLQELGISYEVVTCKMITNTNWEKHYKKYAVYLQNPHRFEAAEIEKIKNWKERQRMLLRNHTLPEDRRLKLSRIDSYF